MVCCTTACPSFTISGYNNNTKVPLLPISIFWGGLVWITIYNISTKQNKSTTKQKKQQQINTTRIYKNIKHELLKLNTYKNTKKKCKKNILHHKNVSRKQTENIIVKGGYGPISDASSDLSSSSLGAVEIDFTLETRSRIFAFNVSSNGE